MIDNDTKWLAAKDEKGKGEKRVIGADVLWGKVLLRNDGGIGVWFCGVCTPGRRYIIGCKSGIMEGG